MTNGRKIPSNIENPIDNIIINNCDKLINFCIKNNITPNMVTWSRIFILVIIVYYLFYTCKYIEPIILIICFYFLDCLDGHLARSTNQVTIFGDYLDHIADCSFLIIILYYIYKKQFNNKRNLIIILFILTIMAFIHLGLQQKNYKENNNDELLDLFNCFHNLNKEDIKWTRYFGTGTLYLYIIFLIYYINQDLITCHQLYKFNNL